jgi:hypothetical protein
MASDGIASLQHPLASVDFNIRNETSVAKISSVELNKEEMKKMVASLEACNLVFKA